MDGEDIKQLLLGQGEETDETLNKRWARERSYTLDQSDRPTAPAVHMIQKISAAVGCLHNDTQSCFLERTFIQRNAGTMKAGFIGIYIEIGATEYHIMKATISFEEQVIYFTM